MNLLEQAWEQREEEIYRELFGDTGEGIYLLGGDLFTRRFSQETFDPRWLHYGVFACPPSLDRRSWLYVSSGMSNPWEQEEPEEFSGFGVEFVLETDEQANWPILLLQQLVAYNILLVHGRFGDHPPLDYGHRIPLRESVAVDRVSELRNVVIAYPTHYASSFSLVSGRVDLLHFIGITDAELAYAKQNGSDSLVQSLKDAEVYPLTLPARSSILESEATD